MSTGPSLKIALIGCGKMGSAMLRGWLVSNIAEHIYILDPQGPSEEFENHIPAKISFFENTALFAAERPNADVFVLAVKPQIMGDVCKAIKPAITSKALVLSIAAGQSISTFENHFGTEQPIIRAMPNTPAAIGKGMTVATSNNLVSDTQKQQAQAILRAVGQVAWIDDEDLMNAVTAVSGSGPAYIFLLIESMASAGEKAGLPAELSMTLARQTVIGAAALAEHEQNTAASTLRQNVTSPGGTTAAALDVLMNDNNMQILFDRAIEAATARGKELR